MIDVIVVSACRPECLRRTIESFLNKVSYSGKFRVLFHEDCIFPVMSRLVKTYLCRFTEDGLSIAYMESNPPIGIGRAISNILIPKIESDFFFYLEDDWEFERIVPLDDFISIMNRYPDINQLILTGYRLFEREIGDLNIYWNYPERKVYSDYSKQEYIIRQNFRWGLGIGLWRTNWVRDYVTKYLSKFGNVTTLPFDVRNKYNTYYWGPTGDYRYIMHTGGFVKVNKLSDGSPPDFPFMREDATLEAAKEFDREHKAPYVPCPEPRPTRENWMDTYYEELAKDLD